MKKTLLLYCLSYTLAFWSQEYRYTTSLFPSANVTTNITYGSAPTLTGTFFTVESNTVNQNLIMDIYRPTGDTFTQRPAVIFAHPGGFLLGDRTAEDMNALCDSLARKGYVTATIDYRKGFNLTSNQELHSIRAVYRGIQDGRTAVRFLRANASQYGIDPNKIYFVGSSAGSFIGLHSIYLDTPAEIPPQTGVVNYFNITFPFSHTTPNLGSLDIGNNLNFNGKPDAVVAMWGGIQNTSLITPDNTTPVLLIHGEDDATVAFNSGSPFGFSLLPIAFGSNPINTHLSQLGFTNQETYFVPGVGHEFYGTDNGDWSNGSGGNAFYPIVTEKIIQFLWKQHKPLVDFNWTTSQLTTSFTDASTGSQSWWWDFGDGTFSNEQNPTHTYTSTGNYQVKLYVENDIKSWNEITKSVTVSTLSSNENNMTRFSITPNPTKGDIQINWPEKEENLSYQIFDLLGKLVSENQHQNIEETISLSSLKDGMYLMKIATKSGVQTIKIIKQ